MCLSTYLLTCFNSFFFGILVGTAHDNNLQNELDVLNSRQNCHADQSNRFYGDKGALLCLMNKGHVAILGLKNLNGKLERLKCDRLSFAKRVCEN